MVWEVVSVLLRHFYWTVVLQQCLEITDHLVDVRLDNWFLSCDHVHGVFYNLCKEGLTDCVLHTEKIECTL